MYPKGHQFDPWSGPRPVCGPRGACSRGGQSVTDIPLSHPVSLLSTPPFPSLEREYNELFKKLKCVRHTFGNIYRNSFF